MQSNRLLLGLFGLLGLLAPAAAQTSGGQTVDCVVNPSLTLKIGSPVSTILARVEVERGDRVRRGQLLARLDSAVEAAEVALAEARARGTSEIDRARSKLDLAAVDLSRGERLMQSANIPPQKVDELRTNFRVAQQDHSTAELNRQLAELEAVRMRALLSQREIRSPVDAVVTHRMLGPGEYVHQDNEILVLAVLSPLHVEAYPPIALWSAVRAGDQAEVTLSEPVGATATAIVATVDQVFDAASGTFGVRLVLANPDGALPAGQRCRVTFGAARVAAATR